MTRNNTPRPTKTTTSHRISDANNNSDDNDDYVDGDDMSGHVSEPKQQPTRIISDGDYNDANNSNGSTDATFLLFVVSDSQLSISPQKR